MATASSTIRAVMTMDTTRFQRGAKDAKASMKSLSSAATSVTGTIRTMMGIGAAAGFGASIKSSLDYQNSLIDLKDRLGVTTEGLSRLHHAAELSGVSQETMNMGLQRMTRRVAEAAQGTGEAVKALDELNISAERLKQLSPDEQFHVLADALKGVEEPADRTRIAMKLFDSEGVKLLQTMTDGSAGLRAMGEEADKMGVTVSEKAAKAARDANAQFVRLGNAGRGLANTMAIQLGPAVAEIAGWLSQRLPGAIDFTVKAFRLATAGVAELGIALIDHARVITYYGQLLPVFGKQLGEADEKLWSLQQALEGTRDNIFAKQLKADTKALEKFSVETGKALGAARDLGLAPGESNKKDDGKKAAKEAERAKAAAEREAKRAQDRLNSLNFFLMGEEGAIAESYARRQEIVANAHANKLISDEKRNKLALELAEKHAKDLADLQKEDSPLGEFGVEAARNMQSAMSDFLFDPFDQGLDGMVKGFGQTIQRMIADAAAAQIMKSLLGDFGKTGEIGGLVGSVFGFEGGGYTGMAPRVGGMDGKGGRLAMVHPDETVIDHTKGQSVGGSLNLTQNINVAPNTDRRTASQIANVAARKQQMAQARFAG